MESPRLDPAPVANERELAIIAARLAGRDLQHAGKTQVPRQALDWARQAVRVIREGGDPLGDAFCRLRAPERRREAGAVYTPRRIVDAMVSWAASTDPSPSRVVDPGAGSGRFLLAAVRVFPKAALVAVEIDPLARLLLEANARVLGLEDRLTVLSADYRSIQLSRRTGPTLFLGNPPYVRHHGISKDWKTWFADAAAELGLGASKLAGLHVPAEDLPTGAAGRLRCFRDRRRVARCQLRRPRSADADRASRR